MKKVSVIIPTYKRSREFVERAINSVLNQSYTNIEIIVVDDNAKPEHYKFREVIYTLIKEKDSNKIIYIKNEENLGGALARNEGINIASGDFITFLDDDDKYLPDKVSNQVKFMESNDYDMSFTNMLIMDKEDNIIKTLKYSPNKFDNDSLMRYHLVKQITGTNTFMYKAEKLKELGGFSDIKTGQEYYLMYRTIKSGMKIGYLDKADAVLYRQGQDCISNGPHVLSGYYREYAFKKEHFHLLNYSERSYIRFIHYYKLSLFYQRSSFLRAIKYLILSVLCSPYHFLLGVLRVIKRRVLGNRNES